LEVKQAEERFPQLRFTPGSKIIYQKDYGVVNASKAVKAYWKLAKEEGAKFISNERVIDIKVHNSKLVTLIGSSGKSYSAEKLVIAAGAWSQKLVSKLDVDLKIEVTQETICYFPPKGDCNLSHKVDKLPVLIGRFNSSNDPKDEGAIYLLPQIETPGVKIGLHHTGTVIDPDQRGGVKFDTINKLSGFMSKHFPYLHSTPITIYTCLYSNTLDHHFYIDKHPKFSNVVIATGFSGHGFKFGPAFGEIVGSLVLNTPSPLPLDTFKINRSFNQKRTGV